MGYFTSSARTNKIRVLSIPFMGYVLTKEQDKCTTFFQFPLWDTWINMHKRHFEALFFQFPLWDTLNQTEIQWNYNNPFQFPLWDTIPNT